MALTAPEVERLRTLLSEIGPKPVKEPAVDEDDDPIPVIDQPPAEAPATVQLADASGALKLPPMPGSLRLPPLVPPPPSAALPGAEASGMGLGGGADIHQILRALAPAAMAPRPAGSPTAAAPGAPAAPAAAGTGLPAMPPLPRHVPLPQPPVPEYRDPLMALANPLTALAVFASGLTRQPLTAAMTALAMAGQAQAAGDQQHYTNAYRQYETELQRASHEQSQENSDYQRALENRRLSLQERLAKVRELATRRRDGPMNAYLDSGGNVWDLVEARLKAGKPVSQALLKVAALKDIVAKNPNLTLAEAEQEYEHDKAQARRAERPESMTNIKAQAVKDRVEELMRGGVRAGGPGRQGGHQPPLTRAQAEAQAIGEVEAAAKGAKGRGITPNQRLKEEKTLSSIEQSMGKIDGALEVLHKYRLAAGPAGSVLRGKEIVENIFGSNQTDREQFRRDVEFLKLMFPRLIAGGARPLAAESKRTDAIIGGLGMGDTTANTIRSLEELKRVYEGMMGTQRRVLGQEAPPPAAPVATPKPGDGVDWDAFPKAP